MAFVRMLGNLLKDAALGPRIVPIVADEARTFGMANLFRQIGIYSPRRPALRARGLGLDALLPRSDTTARSSRKASPRPARSSSWIAAATSYSTHGLPMLPFYIYYSMFGFQRVGDLIWAAADQRARGFLHRRDRRPHDARRRRPAAPGRHQPPRRRDGAQLPRLRPGVRLRARGDRRPRHARRCWSEQRRRLLLRDG